MNPEIAPERRPVWQSFLAGFALWFVTVIVCAILANVSPLEWTVPFGLIAAGFVFRREGMSPFVGFSAKQASNIAFTVGVLAIASAAAPNSESPRKSDQAVEPISEPRDTASAAVSDSASDTASIAAPAAPALDSMRDEPERFVTLEKIIWSKDYGMMEMSVTIHNGSALTLKDFVIECEHSGASGTVMDSNRREIFELLKPGESKRIRDFSMGFINSQAVSTNCTIVRARVVG